ncbi:unnamed protein product [Caenorhabditis sp. 36 PRJEB53466]|nr:unnamed protein product [Caenorhabditis sp. 36 PRJEB53466]
MNKLDDVRIVMNEKKTMAKALDPLNTARNPFTNILPYDQNRVKLTKSESNPDGYINASHISLPEVDLHYILTGCAPVNEIPAFWQMVVEQKAPFIALFTTGRCARHATIEYFPMKRDEKMTFGEYEIKCECRARYSSYVYRLLIVTYPGGTHRLDHIQFTRWEDQTAPFYLDAFFDFYDLLRVIEQEDVRENPSILEKFRLKPKNVASKSPILQCAAGTSRTGTFIIIDAMVRMLEKRMEHTYCVEELILKLRTQRRRAITSKEHHKFIYDAVIHWILNSDAGMARAKPGLEAHARSVPVICDDAMKMYTNQKKWIIKDRQRIKWILEYTSNSTDDTETEKEIEVIKALSDRYENARLVEDYYGMEFYGPRNRRVGQNQIYDNAIEVAEQVVLARKSSVEHTV